MPQDDDQSHLLARLDERMKALEARAREYITRGEFFAVRAIAYGLAGAALLAVLAAVLRLIFRE